MRLRLSPWLVSVLVFISLDSYAAIEQVSPRRQCIRIFNQILDSVFNRPPATQTIWPLVTNRNLEFYRNVFEGMNRNAPSGFPFYNHASIVSGQLRVLSLGEGSGTYISDILNQQGPNGRAYALDATTEDGVFLGNQTRWPGHYFTSTFQNMNLIDTNTNQQARFDEIVSVFSLNFVLELGTTQEVADVMRRILKHLETNGVLRIYPLSPENHLKISWALEYLRNNYRIQFEEWFIDEYQAIEPGTTDTLSNAGSAYVLRLTNRGTL